MLLGDMYVGKSCLFRSFKGDSYNDSYSKTYYLDCEMTKLTIDDCKIRLQLWDSAGTIFNVENRIVMNGILICYDVCNQATFNHISSWLKYALDSNQTCNWINRIKNR